MKPWNLVDTTMLEKAINAASLRQQVISNNIANLNTEGYQAQTVVFESHLKEALAMESEDQSDVGAQINKQLAQAGLEGGFTMASLQPTVETVGGKPDINQEMANLAKNQIMYNALAQKISGIYGALKYVIDNSGR
ncbi:MAG TPA: flagellar basal body rod protein FlgB [Candidatus Nitrosotenuis sp.]|jgi:flagellar basal-body rod protein FlgB|nr:flagellar basal body rod protein FlgB [Candidatus Nitrosotenuis sp.]